MKTLLAVDVGGTKVELALFDLHGKTSIPLQRAVVPCEGHTGIEEIISVFLLDTGGKPDYACLGVAGVVLEATARITNRPWFIDGEDLARRFSLLGVKVINDMTALCAAIPSLSVADLLTLQEGQGQKGGIRAVIAPGTGLGEGYLLDCEGVFLPTGSEGGHADFAPADDEQFELLQWSRRGGQPVSYEMLCSGLAIPTLYDFYRERCNIPETPEIQERIQERTDRTPVILEGAIAACPCPLCRKTLDLFLSILGSEAGNLALKLYATGGLFIGGGILPRLAGRIPFNTFMERFRRKAKMEDLMARIPVQLILRRDAALCGAAAFGRHFFHTGAGT